MTQRRDFFKQFFSQVNVLKEEARGQRHFRLEDLWKLDKVKFAQLKFRVREDVAIHNNGRDVSAIKKDDEAIFIYSKGTEQEKIFLLMQQRLTVDEIAGQLTRKARAKEDARLKVREFMLSLVKKYIVIPANDVHLESKKQEEYV